MNSALPGAGVATVAVARVDDVLASLPAASELLSAGERARCSRLAAGPDRAAFVAAHALLRRCAHQAYGVPLDAAVVQRCDRCGGGHGRPSFPALPGVGASLARGDGFVAATVGRGRVGVDVEPVTSVDRMERVVGVLLHPNEARRLPAAAGRAAALLLLWVRKEALLKAGGIRDLDALAEADLSTLPLEPAAVDRRTYDWMGWLITDLPCPGALAAVVADARSSPSAPQPDTARLSHSDESQPKRRSGGVRSGWMG